jgi:sugar phosphate isomerase/epimerase
MSTPPVSRRDFVSLLGAAAVAAPLAARAASAPAAKAAAAPAGARKYGPLHVFTKPLQWMSYDETAALVAEAGFAGLDLSVRAGGHVLPENVKRDLPLAVAAAKKAGLVVQLITPDITAVSSPHADTVLRVAADQGVKAYRLGNYNYDAKLGVWESLQRLKPGLKQLADLNASLGLHGGIQNHSGARVGSAIWDLYELVREFDPRHFGVQYDIRHAVAEGGLSWSLPLKLLAPWIGSIDLKDFRWDQSPGKAVIENTPIGEGIVPFDAYFKLVRELGVGGPVSFHFEYPPFERDPRKLAPAEKRTLFLAAMKKDLAATQVHLVKHGLVGKP